ncbi:MAG: tyrosine-type recombinase/integrase [Acidimicrobiia bacterium]
MEVSETKTARGKRQVALDSRTVSAFRAHRKTQTEERMALGQAWEDMGYVFTNPDGTPGHPDRLSRLFGRAASEVGLPRIRLHDLRHTHATLALQAGIHPNVVSERLGHASVAFTLDTYSHAVPALQEEAAEQLATLVLG